MTTATAYVDVLGDRVEVHWNGNVWVTSNGAQHAREWDALDAELYDYYAACGDVDEWHDGIAAELGIEYA